MLTKGNQLFRGLLFFVHKNVLSVKLQLFRTFLLTIMIHCFSYFRVSESCNTLTFIITKYLKVVLVILCYFRTNLFIFFIPIVMWVVFIIVYFCLQILLQITGNW